MYNAPIVPDDFDVPETLETGRIRLRPLVHKDVELDFNAVMSSEDRLKTVFMPGEAWPTGLTLEQSMIEVCWHQAEFQLKTSFAYTVITLDESQILGCVYIYPTHTDAHDVEVTLWVRESESETALDAHLYETVSAWIATKWPFVSPAYPGREISWEAWNSLNN
ncbi:MAG: RimJ/RimL family protein N-acetyltransferase [Saprospiraceae bacterium]|jgi:RimJ/RimL family protein N-acetyltransferase